MVTKRMGSGKIDQLRKTMKRMDVVEEKLEHVIHADGTYSNAPAKNTVVEDIRSGKVRKFQAGTAGKGRYVCRVVQTDQWGVWTEPANGPHLDRAECSHWKWGELEEEVLKPL